MMEKRRNGRKIGAQMTTTGWGVRGLKNRDEPRDMGKGMSTQE